MLYQQLTLSFECLSSIGNSLELESMISEVLITFSRKTGAISSSYYINNDDLRPLVAIGKKINFNIQDYEIKEDSYTIFKEDDKQVLVLVFNNGYMTFIYKNKEESIDRIGVILGNFQQKIDLSISACNGVYELEKLNEQLEDKVQNGITKIRENEKMLISQSKQAVMGEMIEMIAHQWRQPITSIGMISNNILFDIVMDDVEVDNLKGEVDKINTQVKYLSNTIDDFRDFFKESKEKQEVSVEQIIGGVMSIVGKQLEKYSIEVKINIEQKDMKFFTFKNELIQVLLNILGNSKDAYDAKAMEDKNILIDAKKIDDNLSINIVDNAGGIDELIIDKIFEPYFSTKKKKNGTGLGLYMSMIIVTEHLNGSINAKNINDGAEFSILIPWEGD